MCITEVGTFHRGNSARRARDRVRVVAKYKTFIIAHFAQDDPPAIADVGLGDCRQAWVAHVLNIEAQATRQFSGTFQSCSLDLEVQDTIHRARLQHTYFHLAASNVNQRKIIHETTIHVDNRKWRQP